MYKDKDRQREANKQAQQRRRELVRQGTTGSEGMTDKEIDNVYQGMTKGVTGQGVTSPQAASSVTPKRGKDIKCFEDLPLDVQETIHRLSTIDGRVDQASKAKRTAIAINYQHLYPDRYYSTGVA